jgi:hypothetical protein
VRAFCSVKYELTHLEKVVIERALKNTQKRAKRRCPGVSFLQASGETSRETSREFSRETSRETFRETSRETSEFDRIFYFNIEKTLKNTQKACKKEMHAFYVKS